MENFRLENWVRRATERIRFGPDRTEVAAELREHIEDKALDLLRIYPDMIEEEAVERAIGQMGDAEEIGRELAKIHRPWLGYLWRASQYLLVIAAVAAVFGMLRHGIGYTAFLLQDTYENWQEYFQDDKEVFGNAVPENMQRLALYHPEVSARQGNCTISVPRAALIQVQGETPSLYLEVCLDFDYPWHKSQLPYPYLWAEDDMGNQYMAHSMFRSSTGTEISGLTWTYRCFILDNFPEEAQWLRLRYLSGTEFELCVELTGEVRR